MPPKSRPLPTPRRDIAEQLRDAIRSGGLTCYRLGKDAGVDPGLIQRFLDGERDIRLGSAARIAGALGLRLVEATRPARGRPSKPPRTAPEPMNFRELDRAPARGDREADGDGVISGPAAG